MPRSSAADGASFRNLSISKKISFSDAPVTFVVTSAVSTQSACAGWDSSWLNGEYVYPFNSRMLVVIRGTERASEQRVGDLERDPVFVRRGWHAQADHDGRLRRVRAIDQRELTSRRRRYSRRIRGLRAGPAFEGLLDRALDGGRVETPATYSRARAAPK